MEANLSRFVPLPDNFNSIDDFEINQYSLFNYHINKVLEMKVYYRCSSKKKSNCSAKAAAELQPSGVLITEDGVHNHPPPPKSHSFSRKEVKSFVKKNKDLPPSKIQTLYYQEKDIIPNNTNAPPLLLFQQLKKNINRGDKVLEILKEYGASFADSSQFIHHFSLCPFIVIMCLKENKDLFSKKQQMIQIDDTFSLVNPVAHLLCLMGKKEGKSKFIV